MVGGGGRGEGGWGCLVRGLKNPNMDEEGTGGVELEHGRGGWEGGSLTKLVQVT